MSSRALAVHATVSVHAGASVRAFITMTVRRVTCDMNYTHDNRPYALACMLMHYCA